MSKKFLQTSAMALGLALALTSSAKAVFEIYTPDNANKAWIEWKKEKGDWQGMTLINSSIIGFSDPMPIYSTGQGWWNKKWEDNPESYLQVIFYHNEDKVFHKDFQFNEWQGVPKDSTIADVLNNTRVYASDPNNVTMTYTPPVNK